MTRDAAGELGAIEPEWDEAVDEVPASFAPKPASEHVALDGMDLVALNNRAMSVARTEALLEARVILSDMRMATKWGSEASLLRRAMEKIEGLPDPYAVTQ